VPDRVLSTIELNRALLARQCLIERAAARLPTVVERMGEVQAQYAPSSYIGLWTRMEGFERRHLDAALASRRLVQGTLMRSTIHLVSRRDYHLLAAGIRRSRREWWLRVSKRSSEAEMRRTADRVRDLLEDGPMSRTELVRALGVDAQVWNGLGLWIDLVRVPPSGTWTRRRADLFATAERWLGPAPPITEADGLRLLLTRHLAAFGPAAPKDVASWAGVPAARLAPVIATMRLRRFLDARGEELLDVPRAPLPPGDIAPPVRLLPTWDAVLLAHARRADVLPERYRPRVFDTRTPHSSPTFLVDGRVAGTWRFEGGRMSIDAFARLGRGPRRQLNDELERVAELHR
jgi:winged helix DNA-binding protein